MIHHCIQCARGQYDPCGDGLINPIVVKGNRLFDAVTGEFFPIKGIAYYPRPNDGLLSESNSIDFFTDAYAHIWQADIPYLENLGVNTIRLYGVDPSQNHDSFMCTLQRAGIYVIVGLLAECYECGIGPNEAPSCYPPSLKTRGQWIINEFSKYTNTLVFSAGNEVTLYARDRQIAINAACQKKFLRDMRAYVNSCANYPASVLSRRVPIGMVNWDSERELQARYFNCRTDPTDELENAEWYGLNAYLHCQPEVVTVEGLAGWHKIRRDFESFNLSIPVIFAEYGCRERFPTIGEFEAQRTWIQVDALYSEEFVETFAGGVVFEYSAEKHIVDHSTQSNPWPYYGFMKLQYGVGYFSPVECDHMTVQCQYNPYPEYYILRTKMNEVDVSFAPNLNDFMVSGEIPQCPDGIPPLSDFAWPSDGFGDLPCPVYPTTAPTDMATTTPKILDTPSDTPTAAPSSSPSVKPTMKPTLKPTMEPTLKPTMVPSSQPSAKPTLAPTQMPSSGPSENPSIRPSSSPSVFPSLIPSTIPSLQPTFYPSSVPSAFPTDLPSGTPSSSPTSILATIDGPAAFDNVFARTGAPLSNSRPVTGIEVDPYVSAAFDMHQPSLWLGVFVLIFILG